MITYNSEGITMPKIKKRETTAWIRRVAATYGKKVGEVGYLFCDDEKILEVNNEFLGHDYSTKTTTKNSIASSSTASCTSAASTTKDPVNANSWKLLRTRRWPYAKTT